VSQESSTLWNDLVPQVDAQRCRRCAVCPPVETCLTRAVRRDGPGSLPYADPNLCFACYSCAATCPYGAILSPRQALASGSGG
jgi:Fe-S-cluster-containing hydrogenase component 2